MVPLYTVLLRDGIRTLERGEMLSKRSGGRGEPSAFMHANFHFMLVLDGTNVYCVYGS